MPPLAAVSDGRGLHPRTEQPRVTGDDLNWALEQACSNAWPSPRQIVLGSWLLRAAGGPTRRVNSVSPLRADRFDPSPVIEQCERIYAAHGRPSVFRVPSIAPGMDGPLARAGYLTEDDVCTLLADLTDVPDDDDDPDIVIGPDPSALWLAARSQFAGADAASDRAYQDIIGCMLLPKRCAALMVDGAPASIAIGVVDCDVLVLEAVATASTMRSRGYGRRAVATLMRWARAHGARAACLQVVAGNAPARALYAGLGFHRELYRYHYRRKDILALPDPGG